MVFVRNAKKLNEESSDNYATPAACTEGTTKERDGMAWVWGSEVLRPINKRPVRPLIENEEKH